MALGTALAETLSTFAACLNQKISLVYVKYTMIEEIEETEEAKEERRKKKEERRKKQKGIVKDRARGRWVGMRPRARCCARVHACNFLFNDEQ